MLSLSSISTSVCQALHTWDACSPQYINICLSDVAPYLGCMLSPVYQHLFARRCSILGMHALFSISTSVCQVLLHTWDACSPQYINICLPGVGMHALSSISTSVCQVLLHTWDLCSLQYINISLPSVAPYLGCMLSPVYQHLFVRRCSIHGMHALSSISTSVCQVLLHTWDLCSLQYINISLPSVAPYLGCMLSPVYQHLFVRRCSIHGMHALSSISTSVCQVLLHTWDLCSLQYINISLPSVAPYLGCMLSPVYQHLFVRRCSIHGMHALSSISTSVCQVLLHTWDLCSLQYINISLPSVAPYLGCMLSPVYQRLFAMRCSTLGVHALSSISTSVCQTLLHTWDACSLQYINICLPDVAPYLGCMLSPVYQHMFARRCSILGMYALSSISTSVCQTLFHTWGACSLQYINICLPGVAPYLGCMLSPVYQHLFARCCSILGMHALFSISTSVCQTLLHTWDACSLQYINICLPGVAPHLGCMLSPVYQHLFARRCSILGMYALFSISTSLCPVLLHTWDACSLQYINVCLPCVAPHLGCMLSLQCINVCLPCVAPHLGCMLSLQCINVYLPCVAQHLGCMLSLQYINVCLPCVAPHLGCMLSLQCINVCLPCVAPHLGCMLSLSSVSMSVCHALLHTWDACSLSPVYQCLFAMRCSTLGMHALSLQSINVCLPCVAPHLGCMLSLSSVSMSVCHALLHTWDACSLSPVYQCLFAMRCSTLGMHALSPVYQRLFAMRCSTLGMHALSPVYQRLFAMRCSTLGMHALSPVYQCLFAMRCSTLGMHALSLQCINVCLPCVAPHLGCMLSLQCINVCLPCVAPHLGCMLSLQYINVCLPCVAPHLGCMLSPVYQHLFVRRCSILGMHALSSISTSVCQTLLHAWDACSLQYINICLPGVAPYLGCMLSSVYQHLFVRRCSILGVHALSSMSTSVCQVLLHTWDACSPQYINICLSDVAPYLGCMLSSVYQHLFARCCSILGMHALPSISTYVCQALGCMLSPVYQYLFARCCSILGMYALSSISTSLCPVLLHTWDACSLQYINICLSDVAPYLGCMLSPVYQHLFARRCSILGVHALSSISTSVCQTLLHTWDVCSLQYINICLSDVVPYLGCMLSPVYQHLFARCCSILGMHALSSISTSVCQTLLHTWGACSLQYINICLPDVAPCLGCMLSPVYQHLFARCCSILGMHALSSISTSVCQTLFHTWGACSLQYINICLPGVAPYLGCMLSPVYQHLFARCCSILGMHALFSILTSVCQTLLHTWDACSLQYINICLPGVAPHLGCMLSPVYQHLFARRCSILGMYALFSISTSLCPVLLHTWDACSLQYINVCLPCVAPHLGCMLSLQCINVCLPCVAPHLGCMLSLQCINVCLPCVAPHLGCMLSLQYINVCLPCVAPHLGCMLSLQYINVCLPGVAPYLGCMLSPVYQRLFVRRCSILGMHALSSISTSVCQALLHTWDACSLQYINVCLPGVAPYLGCMLSPVYQHLFARRCSILGMHALSSISTSVCQALLHTWDACSLQYINICLSGVAPYLGCMLSPVYQRLFARRCSILVMHAPSSVSTSVCQALLHIWDVCSLQYINICLPGVAPHLGCMLSLHCINICFPGVAPYLGCMLSLVYQHLFARHCSLLGMHALFSISTSVCQRLLLT